MTRKQYANAREHHLAVVDCDVSALSFLGVNQEGLAENTNTAGLDYVYTRDGIFDADGNPFRQPRLLVDPTWTLLK